jgi:transcriptional regulator with XRE-family HTH domain
MVYDRSMTEQIPRPRGRMLRILSINRVVAHNIRRARLERGWSQEALGSYLEPYLGRRWSVATVSAAERSVDGGRPRRFDANEIAALAVTFNLPIAYFFMPPESADSAPDTFSMIEAGDVPTGERRPSDGLLSRERLAEAIEPYNPPDRFINRLTDLLAEFQIAWKVGTRRRTTPVPADLRDQLQELVIQSRRQDVSLESLVQSIREIPDQNEWKDEA